MKSLGIYIHIPFCKKKCYYCDFISYTDKEELINEYIVSLEKEILLYRQEMTDYKIKTIFIGGGTPSILEGQQLERILNSLFKHYNVDKKVEISIEANPGLLSKEKLRSYYFSGINRLSMGLQACQNHLLQNLGRIHQYKDFINNLEEAKAIGFTNINVDLMFALPKQKIKDWTESLKTIVSLEIPHISTYSLIIEEGTLLYKWIAEGSIQRIDEEVELTMYNSAINFLKDKGYIHYEISNFAKPGYQCKHNIMYWKNKEYLGFGAAAHSYLNKKRFYNHDKIEIYCESLRNNKKPIANILNLSLNDQISETMFLGLRMTEGVSVEDFKKRFRKTPQEIYGEKLEKLKQRQLITCEDGYIKLTSKGINLANIVFEEMLLD